MPRLQFLYLPAICAAALASQTVTAQEAQADSKTVDSDQPALQEVVVTAEKRSENIKDVPIAITALSGEALEGRQVDGLSTLQQAAPSLQFTNQEGSFANISIRGVGNPLLGLDVEPGVAVIQDGVPYASQWVNLADFFDVSDVQVLRGPQGTVNGRNATGGAIIIESNLPTSDFEGNVKATYGDRDFVGLESVLSGPIIGDTLLGRVAVQTQRANGWITNTYNDQSLGDIDKVDMRATLLAHLTDSLTGVLTFQTLRDRSTFFLVEDGRTRPDVPSLSELSNLPGFNPQNDTLSQDLPTDTDIKKSQVSLKMDWAIGRSAHLTSISAYVDSNTVDATDLDGTSALVFATNPGVPATKVNQISQELTLTADLTDRLDVIFGGLYLRQNANNVITFGLPVEGIPPGAFHYDQTVILNSRGIYTQWRYKITDSLRFTAGVREISDSKSSDAEQVLFGAPGSDIGHASWTATTPRFSLDWAVAKDLSLYASASKGFKSGGFNSLSTPITAYSPESVWNYEIGAKSSLLNDRVKVSGAAFVMDYRNLQTSQLGVNSASQYAAQVVNAPKATIRGIEMETEALVTERFKLGFSGTVLGTSYGAFSSEDQLYPELGVPGPLPGVNVRNIQGNQLVNAPKVQLNTSAKYRQPLRQNLSGFLQANYAWQSRIYFDIFNNEGLSQPAYALVNLSAGLETDDSRWRLTAFASNVADKLYVSNKSIQLTTPVPIGVAELGAPRMFGVSLEYHF
jgi:iron complex outermembrane receptor protein